VLQPGDLVLCAGTLPRATSFAERLSAAAVAGFAGISLWGRDYDAARAEGYSDADLRRMLDDHGLAVGELDPAWWWLPGAAEIGASLAGPADTEGVFAYGEAELFRIAEIVGARSVNAVDVFGGDWDVDGAAEAFAGLCDRAAEHGLLVHVEFLPWSRIPDVSAAWEIVRRADRRNGGIAIDAWHFARSSSTLDDLTSVPSDRVLGVQLDDGPAEPEADLVTATLHQRLLPGQGAFDLTSLCRVLSGSPVPIGVEVFSDDLHALGPAEAARRAAAATRAVLAAAADR
jgi:sugar phosphate isomerase/epimerase